jgi:YesN/AraC family two-component response regulator
MLRGLTKSIRQLSPDAEIKTFSNAEEALEFVRQNGCDILIPEIELYGMDGLMLAKQVKQINPKVNIIFLTVCDEREHAKEVFQLKPSGYIVKPASPEQLEVELTNLRYYASECIMYRYFGRRNP